ncbi:uncharacterized protein [Apostichopus japonicus]|uniref:uncharacterized protein n=1 Tax=Stichopus japonicus TaxID=307972 RepID=UPI003AB5C3FD
MPKITNIRKSCKVLIEWLQPESDKGRQSTVLAKKIISFEKGLREGQQVLCRWGARRYQAIVKKVYKKVPTGELISDPPIQPVLTTEGNKSASVTVTQEALDTPDEYTTPTQPLSIFQSTIPRKSTPVVMSTEVQTEGQYVTENELADVKEQLRNLIDIVVPELKTIKDLLLRNQVTTPPTTPSTPQLLAGNHVPLYGRMENGNIIMTIEDGLVPNVVLEKTLYEKMFYRAKTATSFARQLMPFFYSKHELLTSNFDGGNVITGNGHIIKDMLERARMASLLKQVELEFPGSTHGKINMGKLRDAINDRCRTEIRKNLQF